MCDLDLGRMTGIVDDAEILDAPKVSSRAPIIAVVCADLADLIPVPHGEVEDHIASDIVRALHSLR